MKRPESGTGGIHCSFCKERTFVIHTDSMENHKAIKRIRRCGKCKKLLKTVEREEK